MTYVELHMHSAYSFLDGASQPEELAARAAELGYEALALTDHDGVYGSLEFAHARHDEPRPAAAAPRPGAARGAERGPRLPLGLRPRRARRPRPERGRTPRARL